MNLLTNQIQGILTLFEQLEKEIDFLLENEDDGRKERIEFLCSRLDQKRNELNKKYPEDELKKLNPIFEPKINIINRKLDKLITHREHYTHNIKELLKIHSNRKKMIQYGK